VEVIRQHLKVTAAGPDPRRLEKLIAELDSDNFVEREKASRELAEAGAAAEEALRRALDKDPTTEVRLRVQELLDQISKGGRSPERMRSVRAVEVLERIGTPQARALLADLARQAGDTALGEEMRASLQRLDERR
jgi:hypothetical protein